MAGLILSNRKNGTARDPFALARELFAFEPFAWPRDEAGSGTAFAPTFNVIENGDGYRIEADLPGVADKDVSITLEDRTLVISGSRAASEKKDAESYHLVERRYGTFSRSFKLPETAASDGVTASLDNGVLTINIPKVPEVAPRTIEIKTR